MVERQKSRNATGKKNVWLWVWGAALSLAVAAVLFAVSTLTVQADTPLARPAATLPPPPPSSLDLMVPAKKPRVFSALAGLATWYGRVLDGHRTASGERFDMMAMTCAHKSLPFGTMVRVVDLDTHKSVVVRVNDRGVLPDNRVIDLSYAAAEQLGTLKRGVANVRLEVIGKANP
jgi:rare lipoprotein A